MNRGLSLRSLTILVSVLVILSLVLTACGGTPTPAPTAVPTAVPAAPTRAPVEPTNAPAAPTVAPTAAAPAPTVAVPAAKCDKLATALSPKAGELGAPDKPIVITFVPLVDTGLITKGGNAMADCLGKMTGLTFKIEV